MQNLHITNSHFITYQNPTLTIDILGGVDLSQVERMYCTLRISCANYPPYRTTLDLYNDHHTQKLQRTLCDKWELNLLEVAKIIHDLTLQLEEYRLHELKYMGKQKVQPFTTSQENKQLALQLLKNKNILQELTKHLNTTGILGEDENALILFLALSSYKFNNPFSVICLAKNGIGKSYLLQKLSECMPPNSYSFHTKISANALYYFDSNHIHQKALLIEDLEWTTHMLQPLATLQSQGRLVNTRATKDKDGMLHSTTFEVVANLCLVACAYNDKNIEEMSLPFLCLHLNHSHQQDNLVMDYQKQCKAGLIKNEAVKQSQELLKTILATLQNVTVINPYATLINLPQEITYPRKALLLLLNFIEVITYFFQYQREQVIDKTTGEIFVKTHPTDIVLAFNFLKHNLFSRADELSTPTRGFYNWLVKFLEEAKTPQFTQLDIRKTRSVHPRTLARYLQELVLFSYVQICGGNKHRGGFIYKITHFDKQSHLKTSIETDIQHTLQKIWDVYNNQNTTKKIDNSTTVSEENTPTSKQPKNTTKNPTSNKKSSALLMPGKTVSQTPLSNSTAQ